VREHVRHAVALHVAPGRPCSFAERLEAARRETIEAGRPARCSKRASSFFPGDTTVLVEGKALVSLDDRCASHLHQWIQVCIFFSRHEWLVFRIFASWPNSCRTRFYTRAVRPSVRAVLACHEICNQEPTG
jgi:hypothetical protein